MFGFGWKCLPLGDGKLESQVEGDVTPGPSDVSALPAREEEAICTFTISWPNQYSENR
jgi:hypothetical protein